jgi:tRNA A37 threonylcarbamoyladenosine synthetase subunit TsaC/SUA5/YrdC
VTDGHVLATTSANLSNHPSSKSYEEAKKSIGNYVDIIFRDYGFKCAGRESTVAIADTTGIKVLRQGNIVLD